MGRRPELALSPAVASGDGMVEALRVTSMHAECSEQHLAGKSSGRASILLGRIA